MLRILASLLLILSLTGCETIKEVTVYRDVKVPVAVPCAVDVPSRPQFYFVQIKEDEDIFVKVRALLADRALYESYANELLSLLELCRK